MKLIKIIAIIILVLLFTSYSKAWFAFNGGGNGFCTDCEGTTNNNQDFSSDFDGNNINQLIIDAGGHFLQSNSDFQLVLKRIEISDTGLNDALDQAIQNMTVANAKYFEIWVTSLSLEYDPIVIEKLSQFDYTGYQIENILNLVIFQQVEDFLKQGQVRKLFLKAFENSWKILYKLKRIKKSLEYGNKVDISKYWRLNQLYLDFALFGQYCSEVFMSI